MGDRVTARAAGTAALTMRYAGAAVVVVIVVEIAAAVAVARAISWPLTLLALALFSLAGADLLRREGWAAFRDSRRGRSPQQQLGNAAAGMLAAGLVAVPGFVTGVVGLLGLTPPGRATVRRALAHRFATGLLRARTAQARTDPTPGDPTVVEGSLDDRPGPVDLTKGEPPL